MKRLLLIIIIFVSCSATRPLRCAEDSSFYSLTAESITGEQVKFSDYKGKVLLVVNIALRCGTTIQLAQLQKLYEEYQDSGLEILAFPSSDFNDPDLYTREYIQNFCSSKYGITFPVFARQSVTGEKKHPVFSFLTSSGHKRTRGDVHFNFEKFLITRNGELDSRYGSFTGPMSSRLQGRIKELLKEEVDETCG